MNSLSLNEIKERLKFLGVEYNKYNHDKKYLEDLLKENCDKNEETHFQKICDKKNKRKKSHNVIV